MGEYGNPDEEWDAFLNKYSPYHNLSPETKYPPILFTTCATREGLQSNPLVLTYGAALL